MNPPQLAKYHNVLGDDEAAVKYESIADNLCRAVNQVPFASCTLGINQNLSM